MLRIGFIRQRAGVPFLPACKPDIKSHLCEGAANTVNPLVGAQIVNYRYNDFFQNDEKMRSANNYKSTKLEIITDICLNLMFPESITHGDIFTSPFIQIQYLRY